LNQDANINFLKEIKDGVAHSLAIASGRMAIPLYLLFWVADWIYAPQMVWWFLALRLSVIPVSFFAVRFVRKTENLVTAQIGALCLTTWYGLTITGMLVLTDGPAAAYYAGLNLIGTGSVAFIPWRPMFVPWALASVYGGFITYAFLAILQQTSDVRQVLVNLFFVSGTAIIAVLIRYFDNRIRLREFTTRQELAIELQSRSRKVEEMTKSSLKFRELSRQFSPQIVHAIQQGQIALDASVHRAKICSIFIDVVGSTERITRIDHNDFNAVISRFLVDTMHVLMKYDLTFDKFLGDGILAFSNDPLPYPDYVERTLMAAMEIRERIRSSQDFYVDRWLQEFKVRIGVSSGFANVGFYGDNKIIKNYTAIGSNVNLACRLCSEAETDSIVVSNDVKQVVEASGMFMFTAVPPRTYKGFEQDLIKAFVIERDTAKGSAVESGTQICTSCGSSMQIDVDAKGFYVFRCRECAVSGNLDLAA